MAKQRNVNIVYKVDTKQVTQAKEVVKQADDATNKLIESTKKYETASSASYKKTSVSIQDLNTKLQFLRREIETTDLKDGQRLDKLLAKYKTLSADVQRYNQLLVQQNQQQASFGQQLNSLYNLVRGGIFVTLVKETTQAIANLAIMQGRIQGVKLAFDRLPASAKILNDLRASTRGMLTDFELMQRALQAKNFKIPLEEFATLLDFATVRAQQTGQSVDYLVDSIVRGIGMQSVLRLDNLGISAARLREEFRGVSIRSLEVADVTKGVVNVIKEEMRDMGSYVKTGETSVGNLARAWKELRITITERPGSWGAAIADFFSEGFDKLNQFLKGSKVVLTELAKIEGQTKAIAFQEKMKSEITIEAYDKEIKASDQAAAKRKLRVMMLQDEIKELNQYGIRTDDQVKSLYQQIDVMLARNIQENEYINQLKIQRKELIATLEEEENRIQTYQDLQKELDGLNEQFEEATDRNDKKALANIGQKIIYTKTLIENLDRLREAQKSVDGDPDDAVVEQFSRDTEKFLQDEEEFQKAWAKLDSDFKKEWNDDYEKWRQGQLEIDKEYQDQALKNDKENKARKQKLETEFRNFVINSSRDILVASLTNRDVDIDSIEAKYDYEKELAGNNDRTMKEIERRRLVDIEKARAQKLKLEQETALITIAIDTAANIVRSILENGGVPKGLPFGAIAAGIGLTQAALVGKLQFGRQGRGASRFKDGVIDLQGPGTETSDSIPAMLSRRESVMTAQETKESGMLLRAIRAKKINDEIFEKIVVEGPATNVDLTPVAGAIKSIKPPDLVKQGDFIYEMKSQGKSLRRRIRSKSFTM